MKKFSFKTLSFIRPISFLTRLTLSNTIVTFLAVRELGALPEVAEVSVVVGEVKEHDHFTKLNGST